MDIAPIVKTKALSKSFNGGSKNHTGIANVTIEINKGEFSVIMGNSGSGKSTLLYLLSGLDHPSQGQIFLNNTPIHKLGEKAMALFRRNHIGFVFQDHNLISELSLKENILIVGYLSKRDRKVVQARTSLLMKELELEGLADRLPSQVSGGERQRCAIARALVNNPKILMADEPTGSLNSSASKKVLSCFKKVHNEGQTILMVTHDPKSACYGDRVLFIQDGQLVDSFKFEKNNDLEKRNEALLGWLRSLGW
ncbi:ABC transporter ATP-binding protein [Ulvibacterium marinum]|uniref:ABC transporter ATP-binding protein n=1 Tax=Ulvibacterium marinum TaxID=2419782 RepID=A0A3B0CCQ4_9FLAO|nr:ABC transporter ATP-binding protein [Ulvibacterium marinum]RKN82880.1 ABC transporter ATP-binding protein [Ulvibacterium marinum]